MKTMLMTAMLVAALGAASGCEKSRYADDRHYIGDPKRVPAASEPPGENAVPEGVAPSGVRGRPPADPVR